MRRKTIGAIKEKLAAMLSQKLTEMEGFPVEVYPEDFWTQQGDYRKATWDLAVWGINLNPTNKAGFRVFIKIYSWDRMKDCVRFGFSISAQSFVRESWEREVIADSVTQ